MLADLTAPYNTPVCATGEAVFLHNIEMTGHELGTQFTFNLGYHGNMVSAPNSSVT